MFCLQMGVLSDEDEEDGDDTILAGLGGGTLVEMTQESEEQERG